MVRNSFDNARASALVSLSFLTLPCRAPARGVKVAFISRTKRDWSASLKSRLSVRISTEPIWTRPLPVMPENSRCFITTTKGPLQAPGEDSVKSAFITRLPIFDPGRPGGGTQRISA